jgi:hypothetical protein
MKTKTLPLKEMSISEIYNGEKATYEVPIYQRNYAWEKDEVFALIQDVYDAFSTRNKDQSTYYIGTLVSFHKGDHVYEVIDGQQRLTTIYLILAALDVPRQNKLTYRVRKKANQTIQSMPSFDIEEKDFGIIAGYKFASTAIKEIVPSTEQKTFKEYFLNNVHLIHYQVPKDIDLNHYFEIMNSRGEQLEKHEIVKARLIETLNDSDKAKFHRLWEVCSEMNVYVQQRYNNDKIFGNSYYEFKINGFDDLPEETDRSGEIKISDLLTYTGGTESVHSTDKIDSFQPIIDFSNFLLIVLKLTRLQENNFDPIIFNLDDKDLLKEFANVDLNQEFAKKFGFNLLKAKFLLDNYIVHHANEDDTLQSNPWKLQYWQKEKTQAYLKNLTDKTDTQNKLVHLLSMFEVSFTARQRKNYLFYCLLYLFESDLGKIDQYCTFVERLADKYFKDVYLVQDNLNEINTPRPGSFDRTILSGNTLNVEPQNNTIEFNEIYGDGTVESKGISLFVFNYLDYKLWVKYQNELRGEGSKEGSRIRQIFFSTLGCADFGLNVFEQFYFSRTRRSLEHFFPQASVGKSETAPTKSQINCFGNYAMIGNEMNSSGSNWDPATKLKHYIDDTSGKIRQVSVASLKFRIMMQICKDNHGKRNAGEEWNYEDMKVHQEKMLQII